ncbi:MAG: DUF3108 domain-containing protein [Fidelibacterota bacterium]|nr:MAG: DUF3108 domain-containing protein [Candidatus Neomarinimicrobiota bacterium]
MSYRLLLVILACFSATWGQDLPFKVGETLIYTTGFRLFSAGTSTMEIVKQDEDSVLHIVSQVRTGDFFDHLYRIRDRIDLWLDSRTLELRHMLRDIYEGGYERRDTTYVDREAGLIYARRDTLTVAEPVFDPIGAIYYFRTLPLAIDDEVHLAIFDGRRLRKIAITVSGVELIKVPAGEFECLVLKPTPLDNKRLTSADGILHLWLTDDQRRIPVRIEQKASFGTIVLKLAEVK